MYLLCQTQNSQHILALTLVIHKNFENLLYYSKEVLAWLPQKGKLDEKITVEDPFGGVMLQLSGWLDIPTLLEGMVAYFGDRLIQEEFKEEKLLQGKEANDCVYNITNNIIQQGF